MNVTGDGPRPGREIVGAILVPGVSALRRSRTIGVLCLAAGVVLPAAVSAWIIAAMIGGGVSLTTLAVRDDFLRSVVIAIVAAVTARALALAEILIAHRSRRRSAVLVLAGLVVLAALSLPALLLAQRTQQARSLLDEVFVASSLDTANDRPLYRADEFRASVPVAPDLHTVLLLGGDGGPTRWSNRTDTIMLVVIETVSGRTGLVSVPRNLIGLRFPPGSPLAERYPDGFGDLANAVFPVVQHDDALHAQYGARADLAELPGALAVVEGVGYTLDITIDDYLFMDLVGFSDVIDALGGVEVDLADRYTLPVNEVDFDRPVPDAIGPGRILMDGALAVTYARTRLDDSDYQRADRHRALLMGLLEQTTPGELLAELPEIARAVRGTVSTSLSREEFAELLGSLRSPRIIESIGLYPPLITPSRPDIAEMRRLTDEVRTAVLTGADVS